TFDDAKGNERLVRNEPIFYDPSQQGGFNQVVFKAYLLHYWRDNSQSKREDVRGPGTDEVKLKMKIIFDSLESLKTNHINSNQFFDTLEKELKFIKDQAEHKRPRPFVWNGPLSSS